jgi:GPH family glycoside/pentoside/hexuronide:cation symporter
LNEIKSIRKKTGPEERFIFSLPRLGTSTILGIESWALLTLYTTGYGLDPFRAAIALAIGYLTISVSQFLLGWLSDRKYTKLGRRKPYMLIFAPFLGISIIFLLLPGQFLKDLSNKDILFFWLLLWDIIFRASYAVTTPYQAWMAELFSVKERPKISQIQNSFNYIGNAIMAIFSLLILTDYIGRLKFHINVPIPLTYSISVVFFGILTVIFFYLVVIFLPTEPYHQIRSNMKNNLKTIVKNKNYMRFMLMVGLVGLGLAMITNTMLKYTEEALYLRGADYMVISIFLLLAIFLFLHIWRVAIDRLGKKKPLLYLFLIAAAFLPITLLAIIPLSTYLFVGIIFIMGIAAIIAGWYLFPYIVYADLAEHDQKETGELKAGIYTGFPSIVLNIFQALGVFLIGIILSIPIYYDSLNSIGLVLWGPLTSIVFFICYCYTKKSVILDFKWEEGY